MNNKLLLGIIFGVLTFSVAVSAASRLPSAVTACPAPAAPPTRPIVLIIADKLDGLELFSSSLPAVQRFLDGGACALMNIRSGKKYSDTGSAYLTLGAGGRSAVDPGFPGACEPEEILPGGDARSLLRWSLGVNQIDSRQLIVPEIGLLREDVKTNEFVSTPGLLGEVFQKNGWQTCLIGSLGRSMDDKAGLNTPFRPGGYLLMNRRGVIDEGSLNGGDAVDRFFPSQRRFNISRAIAEIKRHLAPRKLIAVEFGDFYRLDAYQDQMLPNHFRKLKSKVWHNFDHLLGQLLQMQASQKITLVLLSPSVSGASRYQGNLLAPFVIRAPGYQPGLLTSGTTKWLGLVANIDFLPTLVRIAGIEAPPRLSGRVMVSRPARSPFRQLNILNQRLAKFYLIQRPLLNGYMGIITFGWIGGLLCLLFRKKTWGSYLITAVMAIPLVFILIPLFPVSWWSMPCFFLFALLIGFLFILIPDVTPRMIVLSGITWGILVADQITGWHLIRYSALGYSAVDGSRYYGMGNEYMGLFLAASLILAHLIHQTTTRRWPVWIILGMAVGILSMPQFGAKFGGILAGSIGISYYLIRLYRVNLRHPKLWIAAGSFCLILAALGWWDSVRPPEIQTHIGRFIHLFAQKDFTQISAIIFRKLNMNFKLTLASPWMRITILALLVGICYRIFAKKSLLATDRDRLIWWGLLTTGIASYLVNDAGVLALATCLAYGFSYLLLQLTRQDQQSPNVRDDIRV